MSQKLTDRLIRAASRLPGYQALVRRVLLRPSEISLVEGRFLGDLVRSVPPHRPIIEIGTLFGGSTRVIALFKPHATTLITVDSFRWNPHGLRRSTHATITGEILAEATSGHNVELRRMDKREFYASYNGVAPALVFLDANHSYESTVEDIRWAQSVGAEVISGHDYSERFPGVVRAVDECGGPERIVGTLFVLKQRG